MKPTWLSKKSFKALSWNLFGVGTSETTAQLISRQSLIATKILSGGYDILCLQEVWNRGVRDSLRSTLANDYPYITRQTFGDGPNRDSGLFFASKHPVLLQNFEEFTANLPGSSDSLVDKVGDSQHHSLCAWDLFV
jgi:hypothetical protein